MFYANIMKIAFNPLSRIKHPVYKASISFKQNTQSDVFSRQTNTYNYSVTTSGTFNNFKEALTEESKTHSAEEIVDTLLKGFAKEKRANSHFKNIFYKMKIAPEQLGYSDYFDENYKKELIKKLEGSKFVNFINSSSYLPVINGKVPNITLFGKLDLMDNFVLKQEDNIEDFDLDLASNKIKVILTKLYINNPKIIKKCETDGLLKLTFKFYEGAKYRGIFNKAGALISLVRIQDDTMKINQSNKLSTELETATGKIFKYVDQMIPARNFVAMLKGTTGSRIIESQSLEHHIASRLDENNENYSYKTLLEKVGIDFDSMMENQNKELSVESVKQRLKYEKQINEKVMPFFDKDASWLPVLKNGSRPKVVPHAVLRILERFILDTRDIDALSKQETRDEVNEMLTKIYTAQPMKVLVKQDGKLDCIFKHKDYAIRATIGTDKSLVSVYKDNLDFQENFISP